MAPWKLGGSMSTQMRRKGTSLLEDRIRCAKDTGLGRLPSREFAINQAWCTAAAIAADLIAWLQLVALDGELALAKRLRDRLLHTSARLVRGQRRRRLRIPATWPWATHRCTGGSVGLRSQRKGRLDSDRTAWTNSVKRRGDSQ